MLETVTYLKGCLHASNMLLGLVVTDWLFHVIAYDSVPAQACCMEPHITMVPIKC